MVATSAPYGLRPVENPSGLVRPRALPNGIASGYGTNIFKFQPVKLTTDGLVAPVSSTEDFVGAFAGVSFTDSTGRRRELPNWVAGTTLGATDLVAYFWEDPNIEYTIQSGATLAQTSIGDEANFSNLTAGSSLTGLSAATLGTLVGSGSQGQMRILDKYYGIDNDWGDPFVIVRARIATHQYTSNKTAF